MGPETATRRSGFTTENAAKSATATHAEVASAGGAAVPQVSAAAPAASAIDHTSPLARW